MKFWLCVLYSFVFCLPSLAEPYIQIDIIARRLFLKNEEQILKEYPIGVGKSQQFMTPEGIYKVEVKDRNPGWVNPFNRQLKIAPGPKNPLGTRWIGFHGKQNNTQVYGIHGTNQPASVGKFVSHGCIRMKIPDSEDLFERVELGMPVIVVYNRFEITDREGDLILVLHEDPYNIKPLNLQSLTESVKAKYPQAELNEKVLSDLIQNPSYNQAKLIGYLLDDTNTKPVSNQANE